MFLQIVRNRNIPASLALWKLVSCLSYCKSGHYVLKRTIIPKSISTLTFSCTFFKYSCSFKVRRSVSNTYPFLEYGRCCENVFDSRRTPFWFLIWSSVSSKKVKGTKTKKKTHYHLQDFYKQYYYCYHCYQRIEISWNFYENNGSHSV